MRRRARRDERRAVSSRRRSVDEQFPHLHARIGVPRHGVRRARRSYARARPTRSPTARAIATTASAGVPVTESPDVLRRGPRRGGGFAQIAGRKRLRTLREGVMPVSADRPQTGDRPPNASGRARSSLTIVKEPLLVLSGLASVWPPRPPLAQPANGRRNGCGHRRHRRRGRGDRRRGRPSPAFPNNVVVFPDRDFVTIEGYQNHIGEERTRRGHARRPGHRLRQGRVEEGDVAFEINHPGGYCWGAGTGLERHAGHPPRRQGQHLLQRHRRRRHDRRQHLRHADAFIPPARRTR